MASELISRLYGARDKIDLVELVHVENGGIKQVEVDEVVVSHGYDRDFGNLVQWGLEREDYGVSVDPRMRTSISGVFGAGDFITYESKVRLIAGSFNDAVLAVNSAKLYLEPTASEIVKQTDGVLYDDYVWIRFSNEELSCVDVHPRFAGEQGFS